MNVYTIIGASAVAALAACSKSHGDVGMENPSIQLVRSQPSKVQGLTLGQVLDNSPNCGSRKWTRETDKYGRDVVTFHCDLVLPRDRYDALRQSIIDDFRKNIEQIAGNACIEASQAYIASTLTKINNHFARFTSASEVMQFVVNQGEIVETRAGLEDAAGHGTQLSSTGIQLVMDDLQATGDGKVELDNFFHMVGDSAPHAVLMCTEMSALMPNTAASSPAPVNQAAVGSQDQSLKDAVDNNKGE